MRRRLFKFLTVRSGILCLAAILLSPLFDTPFFYILGVILGYFTAVIRFNILSIQITESFNNQEELFSKRKRSFMYSLTIIIPVILLGLAYLYLKQIIIGCTIGILSVPLCLSIYSFTEAVGITNTNFEAGGK